MVPARSLIHPGEGGLVLGEVVVMAAEIFETETETCAIETAIAIFEILAMHHHSAATWTVTGGVGIETLTPEIPEEDLGEAAPAPPHATSETFAT